MRRLPLPTANSDRYPTQEESANLNHLDCKTPRNFGSIDVAKCAANAYAKPFTRGNDFDCVTVSSAR